MKETTMTITFKALTALLAYPNHDLVAALREILDILEGDRRLPRRVRADLAALVDELRSMDPLDAQERYVATFDAGGPPACTSSSMSTASRATGGRRWWISSLCTMRDGNLKELIRPKEQDLFR